MSITNYTKEACSLDLDTQRQSFFEFVYSDYFLIAFIKAESRHWIDCSEGLGMGAFAGLRVLELRGTSFSIVTRFAPDPTSPIGSVPIKEEKIINYDATSTFRTFVFFLAALCSGKMEIAKRIALLAWDPPKADYICDRCSCTKYDQATAYAVKDIFEGNFDEAKKRLATVPSLKPKKDGMTDYVDTSLCRDLLLAITKNEADLFLSGLHRLLEGHYQHHKKRRNQTDGYFDVSLAATGLSIWAVQKGLITKNRLPTDSPYLPLDLLDYSLDHLCWSDTLEFKPMELPSR